MEGITFSLNETIEIFRNEGKEVDTIVSIGGGAKNDQWLQMQTDIFNAKVIKHENEQGPGMGAAMIAAYGCGWFDSLEACADQFIKVSKEFYPKPENVQKYSELYQIYTKVYYSTRDISALLEKFRNQ